MLGKHCGHAYPENGVNIGHRLGQLRRDDVAAVVVRGERIVLGLKTEEHFQRSVLGYLYPEVVERPTVGPDHRRESRSGADVLDALQVVGEL